MNLKEQFDGALFLDIGSAILFGDGADTVRDLYEELVLDGVIEALDDDGYLTQSLEELVDVLPEGAKVRVRYDLHNADKVWLLTLDGVYLGEAQWNGHVKEAFAQSRMDQLRQERADNKVRRGEQIIAEAQAELILGFWWQLATATLFMAVFVTAFSLMTDALRDALDPKLRGLE